MRLVKEEAAYLSQTDEQRWKSGVFGEVFDAMLSRHDAEDVRKKFTDEYFTKYDDVRYFAFIQIR